MVGGPSCGLEPLLHLIRPGWGCGVKWPWPQGRKPVRHYLKEATVRAEMTLLGLRKARKELGSG